MITVEIKLRIIKVMFRPRKDSSQLKQMYDSVRPLLQILFKNSSFPNAVEALTKLHSVSLTASLSMAMIWTQVSIKFVSASTEP